MSKKYYTRTPFNTYNSNKINDIIEKKPTTLAVCPIYYTFSPDIMKKICNIIHEKYYDFIYKKWNNLTVDECIYFSKETKNTEIVRYIIEKSSFQSKKNILYQLLPYSISNNLLSMFEVITTNILNKESVYFSSIVNESFKLANKLERKEMISYFKNYNKLKKQKDYFGISTNYKNENKVKNKLFRK